MDELEIAYEAVSKDYENRKNRIIANLNAMKINLDIDNIVPKNYIAWLEYTIEFLNERPV